MENGVASLVRRSTPLLFPDFRVTSDYNDSYVLDLALVLSWAAPSLLTLPSLYLSNLSPLVQSLDTNIWIRSITPPNYSFLFQANLRAIHSYTATRVMFLTKQIHSHLSRYFRNL